MNDTGDLEVTKEVRQGVMILHPVGEIDLSRAPSLRLHLGEAIRQGPAKLVVDLAEVPYMDSSGVATFVEAMQIARRHGSEIVLCAMQDRVRSIFEIARLDMIFTIKPTTEDALGG